MNETVQAVGVYDVMPFLNLSLILALTLWNTVESYRNRRELRRTQDRLDEMYQSVVAALVKQLK